MVKESDLFDGWKGVKMKRVLIVIVLAFVALSYYQKNSGRPFVGGTEQGEKAYPDYEDGAESNSSQFRCDGRQYCSQMTSRAEAEFFIRN
jgi:hypothetical protein